MSLNKPIWYLVYLVKYLVLAIVVGGIVYYFYPTPGLIVGGLLLVGSFGAAANDVNSPEFRERALKKQYSKLKDEFDGMDQMASITRRSL